MLEKQLSLLGPVCVRAASGLQFWSLQFQAIWRMALLCHQKLKQLSLERRPAVWCSFCIISVRKVHIAYCSAGRAAISWRTQQHCNCHQGVERRIPLKDPALDSYCGLQLQSVSPDEFIYARYAPYEFIGFINSILVFALDARKAARFARPGLRQGSERPAILESPVSGYMEDGLALPSEVQAAELGEVACCLV